MTTQTLEHFDVLDADLLATVVGGVNQCFAGTTGKVIEGALAGGAAGAGIGAVLGGISNGLYGASQYCN
ncbi:Blp family class II bacteriocin [Streptococcus mutans]|uniref:Blp family class II bacteriocin n=1 Tax=Streptococcus mutans TaxID=1309 RepID=UPI0028F0AF5C|nr:Blp family class II bacteriocin [Streptococcus mutans]MDT9559558.1 Blp family class II bacteriocin [Streptococcus mutans]MDT9602653.1 Blp family class II bacteriocin [Streptococcus mutans]